ncbi:uncharacterized protein G2W53_033371 [Senna tora]|uniref:Uncharacterized protein n=1 Tax=Senna tora TaxID=362788 RepID=A0A834SY42_9FABA|nr:uncharacterized protein G2W53_033371 [Senna tora]
MAAGARGGGRRRLSVSIPACG